MVVGIIYGGFSKLVPWGSCVYMCVSNNSQVGDETSRDGDVDGGIGWKRGALGEMVMLLG